VAGLGVHGGGVCRPGPGRVKVRGSLWESDLRVGSARAGRGTHIVFRGDAGSASLRLGGGRPWPPTPRKTICAPRPAERSALAMGERFVARVAASSRPRFAGGGGVVRGRRGWGGRMRSLAT